MRYWGWRKEREALQAAFIKVYMPILLGLMLFHSVVDLEEEDVRGHDRVA